MLYNIENLCGILNSRNMECTQPFGATGAPVLKNPIYKCYKILEKELCSSSNKNQSYHKILDANWKHSMVNINEKFKA